MDLLLAVFLCLLFLGWAIWALVSRESSSGPDRSMAKPPDAAFAAAHEIERRFHNLLLIVARKDKERIIEAYMSNNRCSRTEAMRLYIEDWEKEQARLS